MKAPNRLAVGLLAFSLLCLGCTDDDSGDADDTPADANGSTSGPSEADLSSFSSLEELSTAVVDAGYTCELEYEGLEDATGIVSLCTIGEGQATLRIWTDPADVAALAESGTATELTIYGENWTIDLRDPAVAGELATALGGVTG